MDLVIIKALVNTHQKNLLPNTASKLENTGRSTKRRRRRRRRKNMTKTVASPNLKTAFLSQIQTIASAGPPKTLSNAYVTAQGVHDP